MTGRRLAVAVGALLVVVAGAVVGIPALLRGPTVPTIALPAPAFVDVTSVSGLDHTYGGGYTTFIGGGLAVMDCDDDGRPDLYLAGGDQPATLFRNRSTTGDGPRFERILDGTPALDGVMGAYPLDVDADGHADLAILRVDRLQVLRGQGNCRFSEATDALGLAGIGGWTTAFSATWEGPDGLPTLAVGKYLLLDDAGEPVYRCDDNVLLRPDASGARYAPPVSLDPGYCALSMLFSDWDGSGRRDLRVSNDRQYYDFANGEEQLWRIEPGLPPFRYTSDDGWVKMQLWGMGIASRDLTGDGLPEVYLTSQGDNKLQTLTAGPAQPMYRDIALKRGVLGTRPVNGGDPLPSTAWHPQFEDVNNDGFVDLFVSKGNVAEQEGYATRDPSNLFVGQPDGTFLERAAEAGIVEFDRGRGSALVDLDGDGLLDLVEVKLDAPVRVWWNVGSGAADAPVPMGHWLGVQVRQRGANRDAIGAVVEVDIGGTVTRREVIVGGGHGSGQLGPLHAGLGPAEHARIRVTWPDGTQGGWVETDADRLVVIERGAGGPDTISADGAAD